MYLIPNIFPYSMFQEPHIPTIHSIYLCVALRACLELFYYEATQKNI